MALDLNLVIGSEFGTHLAEAGLVLKRESQAAGERTVALGVLWGLFFGRARSTGFRAIVAGGFVLFFGPHCDLVIARGRRVFGGMAGGVLIRKEIQAEESRERRSLAAVVEQAGRLRARNAGIDQFLSSA